MSSGEECYQAVCDAPDMEAAVRSLSHAHWTALYSHLLQTYDINGVSGELLGLMMGIGALRYAMGGIKS